MAEYPSLEALEGTHTFPGPYTFKVFGTHVQAFIDSVHARTGEVLDDDARYTMEVRPSSKGTYCVAQIDVHAQSAEEVQRLYVALAQVEGMKTLL